MNSSRAAFASKPTYIKCGLRVYWDRNDWWVGIYRGPHHWYCCPIPCLVFRWPR